MRKKREKKEKRKKKKPKKKRRIEEKVAKSEEEVRKLVPEHFHKWMPTRKLWDHTINVKEVFVPKKGKVYLLSKEERKEIHKFISKQLRKWYIRPSNSSQIALVFFVGKKDSKKKIV